MTHKSISTIKIALNNLLKQLECEAEVIKESFVPYNCCCDNMRNAIYDLGTLESVLYVLDNAKKKEVDAEKTKCTCFAECGCEAKSG